MFNGRHILTFRNLLNNTRMIKISHSIAAVYIYSRPIHCSFSPYPHHLTYNNPGSCQLVWICILVFLYLYTSPTLFLFCWRYLKIGWLSRSCCPFSHIIMIILFLDRQPLFLRNLIFPSFFPFSFSSSHFLSTSLFNHILLWCKNQNQCRRGGKW